MTAKITKLWWYYFIIKCTRSKNGITRDVVLGYDNFEDYKTTTVYFGAVIGRCANRIEKAEIEIDGERYQLSKK